MTVIKPFPGGQEEFLSSTEYEVLFGGETKPGKSWALVIDALGLQYTETELGCAAIDIPEYRAVIFRRETGQLTQLVDEMHKYYPDFGGKFASRKPNEPGSSYTFPSGAKIFACHMKDDIDKENHQGKDYQFIGFDELPHFLWSQYSYLFSRAVSKRKHLNPRIRATANPAGANLIWVRERFIECLDENEASYFLPGDTDENQIKGIKITADQYRKIRKGEDIGIFYRKDEPPRSRRFIPGYLEENELIVDKEGYRASVRMMGNRYAEALLNRNWWAFSGTFFEEFDSSMVIEPFKIPKEWALEASMDPGFSSPLSFSLRAKDFEGNIYRIATYYEPKRSARQHAEAIRSFIETCPWTQVDDGKGGTIGRWPDVIVSGKDAWHHKDRYAVTNSEVTLADVFADYGIYLRPAVTDRKPGWWAVKSAMRDRKYYVFDISNKPFLKEVQGAVCDERDPEDIKGKGNDATVSDHALDEDRYGMMSIYTPKEPYKEQKKTDRDRAAEDNRVPSNDELMTEF